MAVNKLGIFSDPLLDRQLGEIVREFTPENWVEPELLNGWVNFESGRNPAGYYKHLGRVYLRGMVKSGSISSAIFTLPAGYRPAFKERLIASSYGVSISPIDIATDGNVSPSSGSSNWISLDGLSFRVA